MRTNSSDLIVLKLMRPRISSNANLTQRGKLMRPKISGDANLTQGGKLMRSKISGDAKLYTGRNLPKNKLAYLTLAASLSYQLSFVIKLVFSS